MRPQPSHSNPQSHVCRHASARTAPARRGLFTALALIAIAGLSILARPQSALAYAISQPGVEDENVPRSRQADAGPATARGIVEYTVQQGDTLYDIASKHGICPETLIWANNMESNPDRLSIGQKLTILPVDGVLHKIAPGDTLGAIAGKYKADADAIRSLPANHLAGENPLLQAGQNLIVPGGVKPRPAPKPALVSEPAAHPAPPPAEVPAATSHFVWPVAGTVAQGFRPYHRAIDILAPLGTPVKAADAGYVCIAGWSNSGWGNYVVVDHGNGYRTLYAHLSRIDVKPGQAVQQNDVIGAVGDTGNATAFHLHLEIYQNGAQVDPAGLLG